MSKGQRLTHQQKEGINQMSKVNRDTVLKVSRNYGRGQKMSKSVVQVNVQGK